MKHTPGPFETSCLSDGTQWTVVMEGGDMLADLTGCHNEKANALLFAAAPDLLAALEDATVRMDRARSILQRDGGLWLMLDTETQKAAIAKAEQS